MGSLESRSEASWTASVRRAQRMALAAGGLMAALGFARTASARDDIVVELDPSTAFVTLAIDGFASDIALADGIISIETDDASCIASVSHPCTYVVNSLVLDLVGFTLPTDQGNFRVDAPFSVIDGPIVVVDSGAGFEIPVGVSSRGGGTVSGPGVDTGVEESVQPLSSPLGLSLDVKRQAMALEGGFTTSLEGHVASGTISASGVHPFVNVPPVANAGPDRTVVCAGNVTLSTSGSSDANDSITLFRWSENGVVLATLDPSTGSSVSIPFSLGMHTVTLEAFDEFGARGTDTVSVNVTDAPAFTSVPGPITTTACGALNLGQATATWCGAVSVTNNAPASFFAGVTVVTWTASAANGKTATAKQRVEVELGDNSACCPPGFNVVAGTPNNDTLNGTSGNDCILGRGGQDTISGGTGNDIISGGAGDDVINAGSGNDTVYGGSGQDQIIGDLGDDLLKGGDGDDVINGGAGNDRLVGGQGQDQLLGGDGDDVLIGETGDDTLNAAAGNDQLVGSGLHDTCIGGTGTNLFSSCQKEPDVSPSFVVLDSCADGILDGQETAVDCGGPACNACSPGLLCATGADCETNVCSGAGACQAQVPGGSPLQGLVTFSTDWGGGYCAVLHVNNPSGAPISGWSATVDTNASTIYTTWNGNFSANHGRLTITPSQPSNQSIAARRADDSIGFCANRDVSNSGKLPFVVLISGGSF